MDADNKLLSNDDLLALRLKGMSYKAIGASIKPERVSAGCIEGRCRIAQNIPSRYALAHKSKFATSTQLAIELLEQTQKVANLKRKLAAAEEAERNPITFDSRGDVAIRNIGINGGTVFITPHGLNWLLSNYAVLSQAKRDVSQSLSRQCVRLS